MHASRALALCKRIAAMSPAELADRARQEVCKRSDLWRFKAGLDFCKSAGARDAGSGGRFFFRAEEVPGILAFLRERLPEAARELVERAEKFCRHEFDLLGYEGLDYGREIDWHLDAVHGKRAPLLPWFQVPYLDFERVGDAKITWELNRHQHLVVLAIAYRLTGDARYLAALVDQWRHWREANPYPLGINWASSLEVAFRSLSWLWASHLLAGCAAVPAGFFSEVNRALRLNARHIESYLSTYFSPNTHLLGEGVALFFIGTLCPGGSEARRWQERGWRIVLREARRQVRPDGMHFEQSLYYHVYALDFFLHARILAAHNGIGFPADFDRTILKMLEALFALHAAGPLPRLGDDDGGRVFDPRRNRTGHLLDPLWTGAALFERPDFKTRHCTMHPEMIWLLGPERVKRFGELTARQAIANSFALKSSGLYVMAAGQRDSQRLIIDAGPHGGGRGGHGHADALSVQLSAGGRELLIDPGTFVYAGDPGVRDHFRETAAHNTANVDAMSQSQPAGPFLWRNQAEAKAEEWFTGRSFDLFIGSHSGFERLPDAVIHRRSVFFLKPETWLIHDEFQGSGEHLLDLSWHFAPGHLNRIPGGARFEGAKDSLLSLTHAAEQEWSPEIVAGWHSPVYGQREPSPVFRLSTTAQLPVTLGTLLHSECRPKESSVRLQWFRVPSSRGNVDGYWFQRNLQTHYILFASAPGIWKAGPCLSDARFVYCSTGPLGDLSHFVLCKGSLLEFRGRRLFSSSVPVSQHEQRAASASRGFLPWAVKESALLDLASNRFAAPLSPDAPEQRGL